MPETLLGQLKALWFERRRELDARYRRTLPLADYVVDRWERATELGFGEGTSVYDSVLVLGEVRVGTNTWIGPFVVLDGSGGLSIGSHCSISAGAQIYSHDTVDWALSGGLAKSSRAPTSIGDNCYIGPNTVVAKGVTIGKGCVIGANSLVLHDLEAGSKAHGSPCRIVGQATLPTDRSAQP